MFVSPANRKAIFALTWPIKSNSRRDVRIQAPCIARTTEKGENFMGNTKSVFKEVTGASIGWAVVMILLGLLAVILPLATGIAVSVLVSWLIVFAGLAYLAFPLPAEVPEHSSGEC